jgi:hypothetical protein
LTGVPTLLSPGVRLSLQFIQLSITYDTYLDEDEDIYDDEIWWGVGIGGGGSFHLAAYGDFYRDLSLVGSMYF